VQSGLEPSQPLTYERQTVAIERVTTHPALLFVPEQTGLFEHLQVSRGGSPRMLEPRGDLASGGAAATKMQRQQDLAARGMRDRVDDCVKRGQLFDWRQRVAPRPIDLLAFQSCSTS
jgi:hypothetical protein